MHATDVLTSQLQNPVGLVKHFLLVTLRNMVIIEMCADNNTIILASYMSCL